MCVYMCARIMAIFDINSALFPFSSEAVARDLLCSPQVVRLSNYK